MEDGQSLTAEDLDKAFETQQEKMLPTADEADQQADLLEEAAPVSEAGEKLDYQDIPDVEETFRVSLTQEEQAEEAKLISQWNSELSDLVDEKKSIVKEFNGKIKDLEALIDASCLKIKEGQERTISVTQRNHFGHNRVYFLLADGTTLGEREMRTEDRQLVLAKQPDEQAFASEEDSREAGSHGIDYQENHEKGKKALEEELLDESDEVEPVTQRTLTENKPTF